jgi:ubiquinone/menaquinone biosynthesis C-methylase UbiE
VEQARSVAQHYSREAARFADSWGPNLLAISRGLLAELPLADAGCVLDVGCGPGLLLGELHAVAPRAIVVGVDPAEGMLECAQERAPGPLALMDGQALALRDGCMDVAVTTFVLHRVPDPAGALSEIRRVLHTGGALGTVTWGSGRGTPVGPTWQALLAEHGAPPEGPGPAVDNYALVDAPAKLEAMMRRVGFASARAWLVPFVEPRSGEAWLATQLQDRRIAALPEAARAQLESAARARFAGLPNESFTRRGQVVYAVARA